MQALLASVEQALAGRRAVLDALNVFPVPDADTGTNLLTTVQAGREAAELDPPAGERPSSGPIADTATVVEALVRGAKGNSGVILSQVLRALLEADDLKDAASFAKALSRASIMARDAVGKPVEGTILTAISAAAAAAQAAAAAGADLAATSMAACEATAAAVPATTDQLPVLKRAGVVDAGARGFEVVLAAVHQHLTGETVTVATDLAPNSVPAAAPAADLFEVQYLVGADPSVAPALQQALEAFGESVVVATTRTSVHAHVHTDDVGAAIEAGVAVGKVSDIEVTRLPASGPRLVAKVDGEALTELTRSAGAVAVPADMTLAQALNTDQHTVVIGARPATSDTVHVIAAASTPPAVVAVLALWSPHADLDTALASATEAAQAVRAVEVGPDAAAPLAELKEVCTQLVGAELVTVLTGGDVDAAMAEQAEQLVAEVTGAQVQRLAAGFRSWFWVGAE